jgi:hypothetical protein
MITAADALVLGDYFCSGNYHQSLDIMSKAKTGITDILLYLALLPACCRVAEVRLEHERSNQGSKTRNDPALLATPELIHCGRHVVVDAASWDSAQCACRQLGMRIKQRIVRPQRTGCGVICQYRGPQIGENKRIPIIFLTTVN